MMAQLLLLQSIYLYIYYYYPLLNYKEGQGRSSKKINNK